MGKADAKTDQSRSNVHMRAYVRSCALTSAPSLSRTRFFRPAPRPAPDDAVEGKEEDEAGIIKAERLGPSPAPSSLLLPLPQLLLLPLPPPLPTSSFTPSSSFGGSARFTIRG
jgi:hypothetical protein